MKVLLTGASGNLGRFTFCRLADAGLSVCGTDCRPMDDAPGRFVIADLRDSEAVSGLVDGCEAVVHLGNHPHMSRDLPPQQIYLENIAMNTHVFQAAAEAGVGRVVFASSIQVISGHRQSDQADQPSCLCYLPLDEQSPAQPGSTYALSKQAGENMLRCLADRHPDRSYTALRFPWLIGERNDDAAGAPYGRREPGPESMADEAFACLSLAEAADLILAVLTRGSKGYHQFLPAGGNYLGLSAQALVRRYYPGVPLRQPLDRLESLVDISAIQTQVGWVPGGLGAVDTASGQS